MTRDLQAFVKPRLPCKYARGVEYLVSLPRPERARSTASCCWHAGRLRERAGVQFTRAAAMRLAESLASFCTSSSTSFAVALPWVSGMKKRLTR
jgi:hypothetical protein